MHYTTDRNRALWLILGGVALLLLFAGPLFGGFGWHHGFGGYGYGYGHPFGFAPWFFGFGLLARLLFFGVIGFIVFSVLRRGRWSRDHDQTHTP